MPRSPWKGDVFNMKEEKKETKRGSIIREFLF